MTRAVAREEEMSRVGQKYIYTPYMHIYLVISLPKIPYAPHVYGSGQPYM